MDVNGVVSALVAAPVGWLLGLRLAPILERLAREARPQARVTPLACAVVLALTLTLGVLTSAGLPWPARPGWVVAWGAVAAAAVVDAASHRLPDLLVLRWAGAGAVAVVVGLVLAGEPARAGAALLGGAVGLALLALAALAGVGLGDVKLAAVLGVLLLGPLPAFAGMVLAWLLGGVAACALMLTRRVGPRGSLPLGPWLVTGAALVSAGSAVVHAMGVGAG